MTREKQNVMEDFYAGDDKQLRITVYDSDGGLFDLTNCEITYAMFTNDEDVVLQKSSSNGADHIEILAPASNGVCVIKLAPEDTLDLYGVYRHQVQVVDVDANEDAEIVTTGRIQIFKSFARRYRKSAVPAYVVGT